MGQLGKVYANSLVALDCGAARCQDQHGNGLEAFHHTRVTKLSPPIEVDAGAPHSAAHVKEHPMRAGAGSAGFHDRSCSANGDVGAEVDRRELGYGVVGGPFVDGAVALGGAVVLRPLDNTALWGNDKRPRTRRVHSIANPAGRLLSLHLLVDFFVM